MVAGSEAREYQAFRTGLTFALVRQMLYSPSADPADWIYRRRGTVLGHWHQIKMEMWNEYQRRKGQQHDHDADRETEAHATADDETASGGSD